MKSAIWKPFINSKEDYKKRVAAMVSELKEAGLWGTMFIQPTYPYEDTIAQLHYPL